MLATMMWMFLAAGDALQPAARGVIVSGVVQDQTGAVLPAAQVALTPSGAQAPAQTVASDAAGRFQFERVPQGTYDIRTEFAGFKVTTVRVRVGARAPGPVTVVMALEGITQDVSVTDGGAATSTTSSANLNAITVDQDALDNLPILDQDVVSALSRFLDSSAISTGGTMLLVDGIEVSGLKLSASAIQQIKINQDPYAAEFMRPGRGRIEIVTKPGGREYNGTFNLRFRDSALYARNAFATDVPPQQRRIFEGSLGGPVRGAEKTSFMLSGSHDGEDSQAVIFARTLDGIVQADLPTPSSRLLLTAAWNHMQGDKHLQAIRLSHLKEKNPVQSAGGTSLPEVAISHEDREDELTFSQQSVFSQRLLNEFRLLVGDEFEPRVSLHADRRIGVLDAFIGGGAQVDSLRTEHHFTLTETVTWSSGRQTVKFGVNIPDWSWRGFDDRSNTGGSFAFSSLQDFADHRPYSFTQQAGDGHAAFLEKIVGGFVQDDIRLRPNLSVDVGLRYDWQGYFHDTNNFAPRASFAYAPDEARHTVIRGGAGVFYDRTGPGPILDLIRYDGQHLARYVIVNPGYPDPLGPGQTLAAQPASIVQLGPDVTIPYTAQYSFGVERQLRPKTTLSVNFVGSRGVDQFRSRDVNAPRPPDFAARPDPTRGVVRQIESAGRMETESLQFTLRGQMTRYFNGSAEYSFGRAYNDTSGINWMPPNAYDLSLEYARADFTQRHRVEMFGALTPGKGVTIGVSGTAATGRPYSLTTGTDLFHTGTANARPPGVARNCLDGPGFADVDLRASRDFELPSASGRKHTLNLGVDVFNALNHVNYNYYVGNLSSPFFGQAISANPPRRVQFSLRVRY